MLTIRFNRVGKKRRAQFRIVLQENTIAPGGRHVEILGSYDPHLKKTVLKNERISYWLSEGVQPSESVHNLLIKEGLLKGKKKAIKMDRPKKEEAPAEAVVPKEESATGEKKEDSPVVEGKKEAVSKDEKKAVPPVK